MHTINPVNVPVKFIFRSIKMYANSSEIEDNVSNNITFLSAITHN